MENERRARQKAPAGRYALLDELRGLDLVSMMLYHACWDLVFLFDVNMRWYAGTPGRLWQQTICWVFILLSGFCAPFGRYMLRRGTVVFGAGAVVTLATLVFMPEGRVIFGVLTFLGAAMLLTGVLEPLLKKVMPAVGLAVSAVLFAVCYPVGLGWVLPAQGGGPQTHGTAAPPGVPGAGLDGPALAFAVSAASAGDLRRTFGRGSSFCIKGLTQPGSCGILSVVRRY